MEGRNIDMKTTDDGTHYSMKEDYPVWVCQLCGYTASGGKQFMCSTWHMGLCDVCGQNQPVTEPRDFYYPEFPKGGKNEA